MSDIVKITIDNKQVCVYKRAAENAPIVYASMYAEVGSAVLEKCEELGCPPFNFVSISNLRWDEELSPWPHEPVVDRNDNFTGEAAGYAKCLTELIVPRAEEITGKPGRRVIAGYSMGGLFALYAPYVTDAFSASVSASGSVWYPDFTEFAQTHDFLKAPDAVYLSLGDAESRVKNKYLRETERRTAELFSLYRQKGIRTVFEMNPGNHFRDADLRLAKGISWILR